MLQKQMTNNSRKYSQPLLLNVGRFTDKMQEGYGYFVVKTTLYLFQHVKCFSLHVIPHEAIYVTELELDITTSMPKSVLGLFGG